MATMARNGLKYCPETFRSSHPDVLCKKAALKNSAKFTGKHLCNFIKKETLAQVFSCEFCKNFKNIFFYRTPPVPASEILPIFRICLFQPHKLTLWTHHLNYNYARRSYGVQAVT